MDDVSETDSLLHKEEENNSVNSNKGFTWRRACIIPVLIFYFYALGILLYAIPEYIQSRVKESLEKTSHNGLQQLDDNLTEKARGFSPCHQNKTSPEYSLYTKVQQESAKWMIYVGLASYLPAIVSNLVFGSYSDVLGRRFVFGFCTLGNALRCVVITLVIRYEASLLLVLLGTFIDSVTGSFTVFFAVLFSYVSDITEPDKTRTVAIVLFELMLGVTISVSSLATGYFIKNEGFFYPMLAATILSALALVCSVTIIPETLTQRNRRENKSLIDNLIRSVKFYIRADSNRCKYLLLILSFTFVAIPNMNRMSLEALYQLGRPFCWDASRIGWFGTVKITCMSFIGMGSVFILHRCLKDDGIALVGNIFGMASFIVEGLARTDAVLYTVPLIASVSFLPIPMIRSLMSSITAPEDQGALFASIGAIETVCTLLGSLTNNIVYSATMSIMNGFVFLVCAASTLIGSLFLIAFMVINGKQEDSNLTQEVIIPDVDVTNS